MSRFLLERQGPKVTVKVGRELSAETTPELRELLEAVMEDGVADLTLDLADTAPPDAVGIALLVAAANSYSGRDRHFALVSVPRAVFSLLETLRIAQRLGAHMG